MIKTTTEPCVCASFSVANVFLFFICVFHGWWSYRSPRFCLVLFLFVYSAHSWEITTTAQKNLRYWKMKMRAECIWISKCLQRQLSKYVIEFVSVPLTPQLESLKTMIEWLLMKKITGLHIVKEWTTSRLTNLCKISASQREKLGLCDPKTAEKSQKKIFKLHKKKS